jgi:hypothetical protein
VTYRCPYKILETAVAEFQIICLDTVSGPMSSTPDGVFYWAYSIGHIRLHTALDETLYPGILRQTGSFQNVPLYSKRHLAVTRFVIEKDARYMYLLQPYGV